MLPITIPAIGPPPNPLLFEPLEAAVVDVEDAAEVEEAAAEVGEEVGEEVVSRPPSLVVVLRRTETV